MHKSGERCRRVNTEDVEDLRQTFVRRRKQMMQEEWSLKSTEDIKQTTLSRKANATET